MNSNIVVIEDDIQLNLVISKYFIMRNCNIISIYDGMNAIEEIDENKSVDLYVIDINLPSYSGIDILKYIRKTDIETPIIIITASLEIQNFVEAFDSGCNEYIKKPFHIKELEIRVNKLLKINENSLSFCDGFSYNLKSKTLYFEEEEIVLRNKEKRLVEILIQNLNKVVPLEIICDYVWEGEIRENYPLRQLLAELRKKLPKDIIKTKSRQGYLIES